MLIKYFILNYFLDNHVMLTFVVHIIFVPSVFFFGVLVPFLCALCRCSGHAYENIIYNADHNTKYNEIIMKDKQKYNSYTQKKLKKLRHHKIYIRSTTCVHNKSNHGMIL
jgi:hypothetical protein